LERERPRNVLNTLHFIIPGEKKHGKKKGEEEGTNDLKDAIPGQGTNGRGAPDTRYIGGMSRG